MSAHLPAPSDDDQGVSVHALLESRREALDAREQVGEPHRGVDGSNREQLVEVEVASSGGWGWVPPRYFVG